jgi:hypothetical protein
MHVRILYLTKKNSHSREFERQGSEARDGGTEDGKQRNNEQEQWNRAIEKGTLGKLIGNRGRRKEDGRQRTDHVRQGTENMIQGTET